MASNTNYYEFRDAKVAIAMELMKRGWKIYGFHEDESDYMTDYHSPAYWGGIATKDGYTVVIDCTSNSYSGKEIQHYNYNSEEIILSEKIKSLIERLSEVRQDRGSSKSEEETAKKKIEELKAKCGKKTEKYIVVDHYPEYQANPPKMSWHVEKDGVIIEKGRGIAKFSCMKYFDKEYAEHVLKTYDSDSYRYERAEKELKIYEQFNKLLNKIDSAAGCMIGKGGAYTYVNVNVIKYKKENKVVECAGSFKEGQCFIIKGSFNYGVSKGYVYKIHEHVGANGTKYYTANRLDKKLKKELTGYANRSNSFGVMSGSYLEKFKKWIEKDAIAFCRIEEVEIPYTVQKCVKKKVG